MLSAYATLQYLHILLLVYWLGADLGVYLCAKYVERPDLSLEERRRFLSLLAAIDMGPRTALVLMIPTGLLLVTLGGWLPLGGGVVGLACVASLAWLAMVWHLYRGGGLAPALRRLDQGLRVAVVATAATAGIALLAQAIAGPRWLGVKLLAYAGAVLMGLMLRGVLAEWGRGFAELRDPATADAGNARITRAAGPSRRYALALWSCVLLAALMGVAKPF